MNTDSLSPSHRALAINSERLWDSLMTLAEIGATDKGGVCRLALTDLDRQGRELFVRWTRDAGCSVRVARTGLEALRILGDSVFDCILMDIHLPGLDGMETTHVIRNAPEFRNHAGTPIIAVTANSMAGDQERFLACGMDAYVAKPMDLSVLATAIDTTVRNRGRRR